MKLTIISAAYNALSGVDPNALERCVRSVAALPIDHEHLIYDGASTDGTVEVLMRLAREISSLKVVSEKDSGIYEALNKGIRDAQGEYAYVIGVDDRISNSTAFCECVERAIRENYDIIVAHVRLEKNDELWPSSMAEIGFEARAHSYCHQGVIVRTALLREHPFDDGYRLAADYKQLLTLHWNGAKTGVFRKEVAFFSQRGSSATNNASCVAEVFRLHREVYGLNDCEYEDYVKSGKLPLRVAMHFLWLGNVVSFAMGIGVLASYIWRKHKDERYSKYFLFGFLIYQHLKKSTKTHH